MTDQFQELRKWNRPPRSLDEALSGLIGKAKKIGFIYGAFISVGLRGDCLYFVDEKGDDIIDPGGAGNAASSILCATAEEIESGDFLKLFSGRALYAALVVRFSETDAIERP